MVVKPASHMPERGRGAAGPATELDRAAVGGRRGERPNAARPSLDRTAAVLIGAGAVAALVCSTAQAPSFAITDGHPISRWIEGLGSQPDFLVVEPRDIELRPEGLLDRILGRSWRGTVVAGALKWPVAGWQAPFSVLPSLILPQEAEAMKDILRNAPDEFDEDRDGVDEMITYEFIIASAGAMKSRDPHRASLRQRLLDITVPIIHSRIAPFVHERYPTAGVVCHSMIRRYLHNERRTHNTHWDIPSFVSVVVSLDSAGREFDGGFFVTTGTGLRSFIPLQQGDTVVHQSDLLHGVHVQSGDRWSWAMWFQDSHDCSSEAADWWKDEAERGDPVAQTLRAMRARTAGESWKWLQAAAQSGFPRAQLYFGHAHEKGLGGRAGDPRRAAHWYGRARESGELEASYYLGRLERAWGNVSGATVLFKEGSGCGEPHAMRELATSYQNGTGDLARDLELAAHWFQRAADFAPEAMYQAHVLYSNDTSGHPSNQSLADLYLERAARMGHDRAMMKLVGPLLRKEQWGQAVPWLLRLESKPSMEKFVQLYRSGVRMKPFTLFRGEQILRDLADQGSDAAKGLLATLLDAPRQGWAR